MACRTGMDHSGCALVFGATQIEDLSARARQPSAEGFLYSSGFMCDTTVHTVSQDAKTGTRLYTLQRSCVPDGVEAVAVYRRSGWYPIMRKVDGK